LIKVVKFAFNTLNRKVFKVDDNQKEKTVKGKNGILITISLIGFLVGRGRILEQRFGLVLGIVLILIFSASLVISVIKKKKEGLTGVTIFGILMGVLIVLLNYFEMKKLNEDVLVPFIPIIIMLLLSSIYKLVKKTGDEDAIKKARLGMIISIPALSLMIIMMVYFYIVSLLK
jgi:hypothetical protein